MLKSSELARAAYIYAVVSHLNAASLANQVEFGLGREDQQLRASGRIGCGILIMALSHKMPFRI